MHCILADLIVEAFVGAQRSAFVRASNHVCSYSIHFCKPGIQTSDMPTKTFHLWYHCIVQPFVHGQNSVIVDMTAMQQVKLHNQLQPQKLPTLLQLNRWSAWLAVSIALLAFHAAGLVLLAYQAAGIVCSLQAMSGLHRTHP